MKKVIAILLIALLATALVFASGSKEEAAKPTASTGPKAGGTLTIGSNADALGLVPWEIIGPTTGWIASDAIFETLFKTDAEGNLYPYLLESYETDIDNLTWTFVVRDGVYFQDGTPFDAEALKWNLENYAHNGIKRASYFSKLDYIEVVDPKTVVMHLTEWDATFFYSLTREAGKMGSPTFYKKYVKDDWSISDADYAYIKTKECCGTGPFMLDSWETGSSVKLVKNPNYWNGDVLLDGITFKIFSDFVTLEAAMNTKEIDIWYGVTAECITKWRAANQYGVFYADVPDLGGNIGVIGFDMTDPSDPLSKLEVRQAICYAIDWDAISSAIYYDNWEVLNQMAWKGSAYYNPDVKGYEYNPEKAKELLKKAGYENGCTVRMTYGTDGSEPLFTAIQGFLAEVGITCEPVPMARAEISAALYDWGQGMYLHGTSMPSLVFAQLGVQFLKGASNAFGANNFIISDELDSCMRGALAAASTKDAEKLIQRAQKILIDEDCIVLPTVYTHNAVAKQDYVHLGESNTPEFFMYGLNEIWLDK